MAYLESNPKTKKAAKELVATGRAFAFCPGLGSIPQNGKVSIEGPHYPKPHTWYGQATIENGKIVKLV